MLAAAGAPAVRVVPGASGWRIEGDPGMQDWTLRRAEPRIGGFLLVDGERELGRTMGAGTDSGAGPRHLLLEDGRLFRIAWRGRREGALELSGWEAPGAYLRAVPDAGGWRVNATAAGGGIPDIRVLTLLLAAEALDADGPLEAAAR